MDPQRRYMNQLITEWYPYLTYPDLPSPALSKDQEQCLHGSIEQYNYGSNREKLFGHHDCETKMPTTSAVTIREQAPLAVCNGYDRTDYASLSTLPSQYAFDDNRLGVPEGPTPLETQQEEWKDLIQSDHNILIGFIRNLRKIVPQGTQPSPFESIIFEGRLQALHLWDGQAITQPVEAQDVSTPLTTVTGLGLSHSPSSSKRAPELYESHRAYMAALNSAQSTSLVCNRPVSLAPAAEQDLEKFKAQCELCLSRFTRSATLQEHMRTHKNERPFSCARCPKSFVRFKDKNRHETLHTEHKSFICGGDTCGGQSWGCGRKFVRKDGLQAHLRTERAKGCIQSLVERPTPIFMQGYIRSKNEGKFACSRISTQADPFCNAIFDHLKDFVTHLRLESSWNCAKSWLIRYILDERKYEAPQRQPYAQIKDIPSSREGERPGLVEGDLMALQPRDASHPLLSANNTQSHQTHSSSQWYRDQNMNSAHTNAMNAPSLARNGWEVLAITHLDGLLGPSLQIYIQADGHGSIANLLRGRLLFGRCICWQQVELGMGWHYQLRVLIPHFELTECQERQVALDFVIRNLGDVNIVKTFRLGTYVYLA